MCFFDGATGQYAIGHRSGTRYVNDGVSRVGALPTDWPVATALGGGYFYLADPRRNHHIVAHRSAGTLVLDEDDIYPLAIGSYSLVAPLDGTWMLGYDPHGPYLIVDLDFARDFDTHESNLGLGTGWTSITPMG